MMETDENALICDLAETYGIYDYQRVSLRTLGILCAGLRDDARIIQKINGIKADSETIVLARILDALNLLLWSKTKHPTDQNKPKSIADEYFVSGNTENISAFDTPEDFERMREAILENIKNG